MWAEYRTIPKPRALPQAYSNDLDDAIDSLCNPRATNDEDEDEYNKWKRCEQVAEKGSSSALDPIQYWIGLRGQYPNLSKLALDVLSIPSSSCECERMFSELGDLLEPRRRGLSARLLAAIQCVRRWRRAGFGDDEVVANTPITEREKELLYSISTWDDDQCCFSSG